MNENITPAVSDELAELSKIVSQLPSYELEKIRLIANGMVLCGERLAAT